MQPVPAFQAGEHDARELEVAMYAAFVLLHFEDDAAAKVAWLADVGRSGQQFCAAKSDLGSVVYDALQAPTRDQCNLVSQSLPTGTPMTGEEVAAYMKAYRRKPVRYAASPDDTRRSSKIWIRRAQCCVDRIAEYINAYGSGMNAKMGAAAHLVSPAHRADAHHGSPSRVAAEATRAAAQATRKHAHAVSSLESERATKAAAIAAAVRTAEQQHAARVKVLKATNVELNDEIIECHGMLGALEDQAKYDGPVGAAVSKLYERTDGGALPADLRLLIMEQLSLGIAPSAVIGAMKAHDDALLSAAGEAAMGGVQRPSLAAVMVLRFELAYVVLFCAAVDVIALVGGGLSMHSDGTSVNQLSVLATAVQKLGQQITISAGHVSAGTTAAAELEATKLIFARGREKICDVRAELFEMGERGVADAKAAAEAIPDPALFDLSIINGGGSVMTDCCNQAKLLSRLIVESAADAMPTALPSASNSGSESDGDSDGGDESNTAASSAAGPSDSDGRRALSVFCHNHLRCTASKAGAAAAGTLLQEHLEASAAAFHARDRVVEPVASLMRALWKEMSDEYAKGHAGGFFPWLLQEHPDCLLLALPRGECGSRHDWLEMMCAVAIVNLPMYIEWFEYLAGSGAGDDQKVLLDSLRVRLACAENVAFMRVAASFWHKFTRPEKYLVCSKKVLINAASMAGVLERKLESLLAVQANPSCLFSAAFIPFASISDDAFQRYIDKHDDKRARSPSRSVLHNVAEKTSAILSQAGADEADAAIATELARAWAQAAAAKMQDPATPTSMWLADGVYGEAAQAADKVKAKQLEDAPRSNDGAEGIFSAFKAEMKKSRGICESSASGLAIARLNHTFAAGGTLKSLDAVTRTALFRCARKNRQLMKQRDELDRTAQAEYWQSRRNEMQQRKRVRAMRKNARALRYFDMARLASSAAVRTALAGKPEAEKHSTLKTHIEIYWHGYGCAEAKTKWTSGGTAVKSSVLKKHLCNIIAMVDSGDFVIPDAAPAGRSHVRAVKVLGTLTDAKQKILLQQEVDVSGTDALAFIEAETQRAASRGGDEHAHKQPETAPSVRVGLHILANTAIVDAESGADIGKQWLPGVVSCVSDGSQEVVANRVKKRGNPEGWACISFEDGYEDWFLLSAATFNCRALRSWQIDLDFGADGMQGGS